jgi:hypothetical protein
MLHVSSLVDNGIVFAAGYEWFESEGVRRPNCSSGRIKRVWQKYLCSIVAEIL